LDFVEKNPLNNSDISFIWDLFINDFYHEKNGIISIYFAFALHLMNQGTLGFLTAEGDFFPMKISCKYRMDRAIS